MSHLATWADSVVRWDSKLFDWLGNPVLTEETADRLHQDSVAAHVAAQYLVAAVDTQRLTAGLEIPRLAIQISSDHIIARITDQAPVARVETQRLRARVTDGH